MQEKAALQKAMQDKSMLVLYRDELGAEEYAGIPVSVQDELVLLHKENNFALDGYVALRTGDITQVEQMDESAFCKKALAGEKVYDAVLAPAFPCGNWNALFAGIQQQYAGWAAVYCEGGEEYLCCIGRIQSVDQRYVTIKQVDADGTWHADSVTLPLDDLTQVSFGDRYLNIFRKYCKG